MFQIDVPKGTSPEMFAMMFGTRIKGIHIALSQMSENKVVISSPRSAKMDVRRLARELGCEAHRAYKEAWGREDNVWWTGGGSTDTRSKSRKA